MVKRKTIGLVLSVWVLSRKVRANLINIFRSSMNFYGGSDANERMACLFAALPCCCADHSEFRQAVPLSFIFYIIMD
jgi:hypothetical protein